ncbi:hypothetical protein DFJ58DRAFT_764723 [Suillus subalutaceus]|uniref:uncharacterized protein n=1 Tax=Suillus subalutaceus TaxID=48586 RepID=UPI001B85F52A|nr:uncharacterized protein DFJ58DRAFT_764723 [Suillus subalutaceus]KAG1870115.1 hypothetical protein DFJ58DRAFT_764723 [Suillus subalutaceus]
MRPFSSDHSSIPPPNLPDKIARGIIAAKGPNDWPHSVTATRTKLLDLARARAMEERRKPTIDEDVIFLSGNVHRPADLSATILNRMCFNLP